MGDLALYRSMVRARTFELCLANLWYEGKISGELHLATGEEAIAAAVTASLGEGDAVALDHRATPVLALLGVPWPSLLAEMLGREDGLCRGRGGHMHLFSAPHLAASSGIVGAAGPLGAGFALSARRLRPGTVAVAFFGEGAVNQGMLLETLNLASVFRLPLVLVCKDNGWAITTRSAEVTAGNLVDRARAFAIPAAHADGADLEAVSEAVEIAFHRARSGDGPTFLHLRCPRLDGHFLGDPMLRAAEHPASEGGEVLSKVLSSVFSRGGATVSERVASMRHMTQRLVGVRADRKGGATDPLERARKQLGKEIAAAVEEIEAAAVEEARQALAALA